MLKRLLAIFLMCVGMTFSGVAFTGCEVETDEGPIEEAGDEIEEGTDEIAE